MRDVRWRDFVVLGVLGAGGCFSESPTDDGPSAMPTGSGDDTAAPGTTAVGDTTSAPTDTTGDDQASSTGVVGDTTGGAEGCGWSLAWPGTTDKDIVFVMIDGPAQGQAGLENGSSFYAYLDDIASSAGTHIAGVTPCMPGAMGCPVEGDGYTHLFIPVAGDPLPIADTAAAPMGFLRDAAPDHYVMLSEVDTAWSPEMLAGANPRLRDAHLHIRIAPATSMCGAFPGLTNLGMLPGNSLVCNGGASGYGRSEVVDATVLAEQPACTLPAAGGGLEPGATDLELHIGDGTRQMVPAGPVVSCADDPSAWRLVDPVAGPVQLCPALCKAVAGWAPGTLVGEVRYTCP